MAVASSSFTSSKETTNYARLCRLLVDVGSQVLRSTFDKIHPPATLPTVLGKTSVHYTTLQSLYKGKKKVLNPTQWGKLYPAHSPVSSATFDITLLTVLLRNVCGLSSPATGWDHLPPAANTSIADDIARVKYYRNTVYGHASQASVDDISFSAYWQEIREALVRLGGAHFRTDIDNLEHDCMDPDIEEHYRELMKQWKKDDNSIKERLEEMEEGIKQSLEQMKGEIETKLTRVEIEMREFKEKLGRQAGSAQEYKNRDVFDPIELIDGIRQLYKTREGWLSPFPWCEEFQFFVGDIFTRLKVVRRKKTRGEVTDKIITMSSLLNPHEECSEPRTVLIEGNPGMGKTTYCKKYVYDWATKKQNPRDCISSIKTVLLLKCRDIKSDIWEAIDDQLLPQDLEEGAKEQFFQFIRENQSNVLLILDGLDELPSSKVPLISEVIAGRLLPKCYIVVTARHETGVKVRKCCDTLLEVEGFTEAQARKFIAKYFKEESELAEKLSARISRDENLKEMCANPLNTALLCLLCEEFGGTLPENRTKLYLNMIECVLRRYRKKTELPDTKGDLTNLYKSQLKTLGLIALNGLNDDKLDFEENELGECASDIAALGFLSVHHGGSKLKPSLHYAFLHKSFQECFAAFYIYCELRDGRIKPEQLVTDDRYFSNLKQVLLFSCGILAEHSTEQAAALVANIGNQFENVRKYNVFPVQVVLEAINECKRENGDFHLQLARRFGSSVQFGRVDLRMATLRKELVVILCEAIKNSKSVTALNLSDNGINESGATCIADAIKVIDSVSSLDLSRNCLTDIGAISIAEAMKDNTTVTELNLSGNGISYLGTTSIAEAMKVNKTLSHLSFWGNGFGDAGATSIAEAIEVTGTLISLDLSRSGFSASGAASIAKAIKVNETLTILDLSFNRISDDGVKTLVEAIKVNKTLTKLNFADNGISDAGAASIAEAIKLNKTLIDLNLSTNDIRSVGGTFLSEAIKVNETLNNLDLSSNSINDAGATSIAESIKVNRSLTSLRMWRNGICVAGANSIAEAVKVNKSLTSLSIWKNSIGDAGAISIAEAIKINKTLTNLDLSNNDVGEAGASSIAEAIKVEGALNHLDLSYNDIGDGGTTSIAKGIKVNKTLTHLDLSQNRISDAGASSIAEAIKVNKTLTTLNLSYNRINDAGASFIAEALKVNKTLTTLSLSGNQISDAGATLLLRDSKSERVASIYVL
ncbi:nucleotide-binding oligomerization domain-containing protein 2-like [Stylophora pistillata]|nr:nucleotide-binding oligomerization domain-containing protein 2-like [Stylophora pistillata]